MILTDSLSAVPSPQCFYPAAQTDMTDGGFTYGLRLFDLSAVPSPRCFYLAAQTDMTDEGFVYSLCFWGTAAGKSYIRMVIIGIYFFFSVQQTAFCCQSDRDASFFVDFHGIS